MTRFRTCVTAAALAAVALLLAPGAASAQDGDYPPTSPTTVPAPCTPTVGFSGAAVAGATLNVTVACSSIEDGRAYTGTLASTPVALPSTVAQANDTVTFRGVVLPADWTTNASHSITVVDQATGTTLGTASFRLDANGRITSGSTPTGGNIPRTGSDYVEPALQIGAGLLAAGTLAVVVARRRRAGAVAA